MQSNSATLYEQILPISIGRILLIRYIGNIVISVCWYIGRALVETSIYVPLELVIKNGIILFQEGWWLKKSVYASNTYFLTTTVVSLVLRPFLSSTPCWCIHAQLMAQTCVPRSWYNTPSGSDAPHWWYWQADLYWNFPWICYQNWWCPWSLKNILLSIPWVFSDILENSWSDVKLFIWTIDYIGHSRIKIKKCNWTDHMRICFILNSCVGKSKLSRTVVTCVIISIV